MPDVIHVYCFNRTGDAKERQIKNNQTRILNTDLVPERVTFLAGNLAAPSFGIPEAVYQTLLHEVDQVIHCAWPVNFNLPLAAFTQALAGVVSLIRFSALSKRHCGIQFLSSISSVSAYPEPIVPESVVTEPAAAELGYGQSKHVAERLLDHASKTLGIEASIVRIGQVAGAARTASGWNKQEWLPSLIASSGFLKVLPETLGGVSPAEQSDMINWIPIDQLAEVVVELASYPRVSTRSRAKESTISVYQVVHPNPVPWKSLLRIIKITVEGSTSEEIEVVAYKDWVQILKDKSAQAQPGSTIDASRNPAIKLLEFYESMEHRGNPSLQLKLSMDKTIKASRSLATLESLKEEWIVGWVKEWLQG
jgi:thioester reductase-like protein